MGRLRLTGTSQVVRRPGRKRYGRDDSTDENATFHCIIPVIHDFGLRNLSTHNPLVAGSSPTGSTARLFFVITRAE
jgi:hypothetical protein